MGKEEFSNYNNDVLDIDELSGTDLKINPDFYIHLSLVKLSNTFDGEMNTKDSFLKYRHIIEHIEVLCDAANLLPEDFEDQVKKFKETDEYKKEEESFVKSAMLARNKLKFMMKRVFKGQLITDALKA